MKLLDANGDNVRLVYLLLLADKKNTFLPDLYDLLGEDRTLEMMEVFAGQTIEFPSVARIEELTRDVEIFVRIQSAPKKKRSSVIRDLADTKDLRISQVRRLHSRMSNFFENKLGMRFLRVGSKSTTITY